LKPADRIKNYFLCWRRYSDELEWLRPDQCSSLVLPRPLVIINGAFDLLHAGHMRLIFNARDRAKTLICLMDTDDKVRESKGPGRPVMSFLRRAATLSYMPIDYLVPISSDKDFVQAVRGLKPDLRVLSKEYVGHKSRVEVPTIFIREFGLHSADIIARCAKVTSAKA
jgi:cytidyltransferase-like protein